MTTTPQIDLNRWRPHVLAALDKQQSLAQYAREHSVSKHTLYLAHKMMKATEEAVSNTVVKRPAPRAKPNTAFVPVVLNAPVTW